MGKCVKASVRSAATSSDPHSVVGRPLLRSVPLQKLGLVVLEVSGHRVNVTWSREYDALWAPRFLVGA